MRPLAFALLYLAPASLVADPVAFLDQHCVECQDADLKKGGLDLTALETDFADGRSFATWVKVLGFTEWLEAHESLVFDPVSIPWNGLPIGQVAGRAAKHIGPGVTINWFEIEGPTFDTWPPENHRRLFGDLPIATRPEGTDVVPPLRDEVRGIGSYLPNYYVLQPGFGW